MSSRLTTEKATHSSIFAIFDETRLILSANPALTGRLIKSQRVDIRSQSITFVVKSLHIYGSIPSTKIGISSILRNKGQFDQRRQRSDKSTYLEREISVGIAIGVARAVDSRVTNVKRD